MGGHIGLHRCPLPTCYHPLPQHSPRTHLVSLLLPLIWRRHSFFHPSNTHHPPIFSFALSLHSSLCGHISPKPKVLGIIRFHHKTSLADQFWRHLSRSTTQLLHLTTSLSEAHLVTIFFHETVILSQYILRLGYASKDHNITDTITSFSPFSSSPALRSVLRLQEQLFLISHSRRWFFPSLTNCLHHMEGHLHQMY